jgi:hypothetical protein
MATRTYSTYKQAKVQKRLKQVFCSVKKSSDNGANTNSMARTREGWSQGGQIGKIFAQWAILYFGQLLEITEVSHDFGYFIPRESLCKYAMGQKWVGLYILGAFFHKLIRSPWPSQTGKLVKRWLSVWTVADSSVCRIPTKKPYQRNVSLSTWPEGTFVSRIDIFNARIWMPQNGKVLNGRQIFFVVFFTDCISRQNFVPRIGSFFGSSSRPSFDQ